MPLDGTRSTDPDPGDSISHYQWFETLPDGGLVGIGNQGQVTAQVAFGSHSYLLDVYDQELGSNEEPVSLTVRDTTPPTVSNFANDGPSCLWPPNHAFVVLRVGRDFTADVTDRCDAQPKLVISEAESSEPVLGGGSGNTSPDIVVFPDHVCLRAERDGTDPVGRSYTVQLVGVDFSGNRSVPVSTEILVPHDSSQQRCSNDRGLELAADGDPRCTP